MLFEPPYSNPRYVLEGGVDPGVYLGAVFELMLIVTQIGTAVVLFPLAKRQSERAAGGYVTARIMEARSP